MAWLIGTLIKATVLLLLVALAAVAFRRASASLRHLLWSAGIVAVLALPALTLTLPWRLAVLPSVLTPDRRDDTALDASAASVDALGQSVRQRASDPEASGREVEPPRRATDPRAPASWLRPTAPAVPASRAVSTETVLVMLWAGIAALLLGRLLVGSVVLARAARRATPLTTRDWTHPLLEAADRLGLPRLPRLLLSNRLPMPYACGILRPTVVLPGNAAEWTDRQRRAVICHELAHVRRFDLVLNAVSQVACALWWFHPLVWVAARRLRAESERACDDLVLGVGTRASEYASHLLAIVCGAARARTPAIALPMAQRREFEGRMLAILERSARRNPTSRRHAASLAAAGLAVVLPLAAMTAKDAARETDMMTEAGRTAGADTTTVGIPEDGTIPIEPATKTVRQRDRAADTSARTPVSPGTNSARTAPAEFESARTDTPAVVSQSQRRDTTRSTVVTALINSLMRDSVATVRKSAAYALGHMEAAAATGPLSERLQNDPSPAVREMTAWALGEIGDPHAARALNAAALQDTSEHVRAIAVWALGQLEDPSSVTPLQSIVVNDSSADVRQRAAWALGSIGAHPAPAALMTALRDTASRVRLTAAWALGQIGDEAAASSLSEALDDQDAEVRRAVFWALGRLDGDIAQAALVKALEDADPALRAAAARVLGGGHGDPWPWPWPMPLFGGHDDGWSGSRRK